MDADDAVWWTPGSQNRGAHFSAVGRACTHRSFRMCMETTAKNTPAGGPQLPRGAKDHSGQARAGAPGADIDRDVVSTRRRNTLS